MFRLLAVLAVTVIPVASAVAQPARSHGDFVERLSYYIRDGGEWQSPNADYKPGSGQARAFGYRWVWSLDQRVARLTIFGLFDEGKRVDFWDTTVAWHPIDAHAEMFQVGAGGALARGTMIWAQDRVNEIRLTFVMPDGEIWSFHETDTIEGPDRFQSVSRRFRNGTWEEQRRSTWTRVRKDG